MIISAVGKDIMEYVVAAIVQMFFCCLAVLKVVTSIALVTIPLWLSVFSIITTYMYYHN